MQLTEAGDYAPLCPDVGRGLRAPCTPTAGVSPLHPVCDTQFYLTRLFPHEGWGDEKEQHHGHNENEKRAVERIHSLTASFFRFPRMLCIRLAAFRRRPVGGRQWRIQLAKLQSSFARGISACFLEGIRQSLRPCGPAPFTQVSLFLLASAGFSCFSGKLFVR